MEKVDLKKTLKHLYRPPSKDFVIVDVPELQYVMIDGIGDPGKSEAYAEAMSWIYSVAYTVKFASKIDLGRDFVVMPLEGLWWADDMTAFTLGHRDAWKWTSMIMQPDWITGAMFDDAVTKSQDKLGPPPESLRLESLAEGLSVQILHLGPFADEAPTLARLHNEYLPDQGLVEDGHHHEIYLSDPRRTAPEKLKTVLRQPVRKG